MSFRIEKLLVVAVLAFGGCTPTGEEIQAEFDAAVADANHCGADTDCVLVHPGCPLGCYVAVNKDHQAEIAELAEDLIEDYESSGQACMYSCMAPGEPRCEQGRCTVDPVEP